MAGPARILVVEDDMVIAMFVEDTLSDLGYTVVGPAAFVTDAEQLARTEILDAAVVDLSIRGGNSYTVADILAQRGIPFVFTTGHDAQTLKEAHQGRPLLEKPYTSTGLERQVLILLENGYQ